MSRSYKHTPYCGDRKTKEAKRRANRSYRNQLDRYGIDDGIAPSAHRKMTQTWDICDYHSSYTLAEWMSDRTYKSHAIKQMSDEESIRFWNKCYKWK